MKFILNDNHYQHKGTWTFITFCMDKMNISVKKEQLQVAAASL